ncbi:DsbA family protein [Hamadaea flava]|uniref:DsbA family protein n=1 Tax=Hamadaea flava TaxID=1742688 RepID=A0ABV8LTP4_9ACTN|nr:DsbA family protein [Hamadaea flava]
MIPFTYAFDGYCGWCYGFAPALHKFAHDNADRVRVRVLSAGMRVGDRIKPFDALRFTTTSNEKVTEALGAVFGPGYRALVEEGSFAMDSHGPAYGLIALSLQDPDRALEFAGAMQSAFFLDGCSLSDPDTYRALAAQFGLDPEQAAAAFASPEVQERALREMREVRELGVPGYPTLLIHLPGQTPQIFGAEEMTGDELTAELNKTLAEHNLA